MRKLGTASFEEWLAKRQVADRERNPDLEDAQECTVCGGPLGDPGGIETDSCIACLATDYGYEMAERHIGTSISHLVGILLSGEPDRMGSFVTEMAVHASEVANRMLHDDHR